MNEQRTHVDLFSGIGDFALAARQTGFRTVAFCECEPYAQRVLSKNFGAVMADAGCKHGEWRSHIGDPAYRKASKRSETIDHTERCRQMEHPIIYPDVRTFPGERYTGATLLTGGFPCQPFSLAGKRTGKKDDRFLWPAMVAVIEAIQPAWIIGENVPGIVTMELDRCAADLEAQGYAVWPVIVPACAVGAFHRRDRVWIVAHRAQSGRGTNAARSTRAERWVTERCGNVAVAGCWVGEGPGSIERGEPDAAWWEPEPDVGRVATGIPARVDRLRGLGNAIVPQVAAEIMSMICDASAEIKKGGAA